MGNFREISYNRRRRVNWMCWDMMWREEWGKSCPEFVSSDYSHRHLPFVILQKIKAVTQEPAYLPSANKSKPLLVFYEMS